MVGMGQLAFYCFATPLARLMQERRCRVTKTVGSHLLLAVAHCTQRGIQGVFAHRPMGSALAREYITPETSQAVQVAQDCNCLPTEGHDMRAALFHARGWNDPFGSIKVNFRPFSPT